MPRHDHPRRPSAAPGWVVVPPEPLQRRVARFVDALRPTRNPRDVEEVLIAELATNFWPTLVMAATFVWVGLFAAITLAHGRLFAVTALGTFFAGTRLVLIARHRTAAHAPEQPGRAMDPVRWDRFHTLSGIGFAASVGMLNAIIFDTSNPPLQMLATGLLFAYCSGIVVRVSVRPGTASIFLMCAAIPTIIAAALQPGPAHRMLAGMFAIFLLTALHSIRHAHRAVARQIGLRLDMTSLARHDPLTELRNRLGLRQAFRELVLRRRGSAMLAVHCFDLDRFKPVNDRHGHLVGDLVLKAVAGRLHTLLNEDSVAARIGGDEFVVLQYPIGHVGEAELFARRLCRALSAPYQIGDLTIEIGMSLGFATAPPEPCELDAMFALADAALYRVKLSGGGVARAEG